MAGFVDKFKRMWDAPDDEYEYDEYGYADEGAEEDYKEEPVRNAKKERDLGGGNKVVNINATTNLQVGLFKPERFGEETRTIADELMKAHTVVLNLEDTNKIWQEESLIFSAVLRMQTVVKSSVSLQIHISLFRAMLT